MLKLQSRAPGEWKDLKSIAGWNGMNRKKQDKREKEEKIRSQNQI